MTAGRNSRILWIIRLLVAVCLVSMPAQAKYGGGSGEPNDPYLIYTAEQMNEIGLHEGDWDKHFKLMADIDLAAYTGTDFNIIGTGYANAFIGVFDGKDHKVSNFTITNPSGRGVGLFGSIGRDAEINNLAMVDANVEGNVYVGSLIGYNNGGTVWNCCATGYVRASQYTGGLVGINMNSALTLDCHATTNVSGGVIFTGGLVGANSHSTISNCSATGTIWGTDATGGITGRQDYGMISNSFSACVVSGRGSAIGGLVGRNQYSLISGCFSVGNVWGYENVGGLAGFSDSDISNCWSSCKVIGNSYVGGLVGYNIFGHILYSYSSGMVTGNRDVGALLGHDYGTCFYTSCFWDSDVNPSLPGIGNETDVHVIGETTAHLKKEATFTDIGWDFVGETANGTKDIWDICEGTNYPRLVWQIPAGDFICPDGVTMLDFSLFATHWLDDNCFLRNDYCQGTDLDLSGAVDTSDLDAFAYEWLAGTVP